MMTEVQRLRWGGLRCVAMFLVGLVLQPQARVDAAEPVAEKTAEVATQFRPYQRPVTTWVAPYAVAKSFERLKTTPGVADALTHLGLQFWTPTRDGGAVLLNKWESNAAA